MPSSILPAFGDAFLGDWTDTFTGYLKVKHGPTLFCHTTSEEEYYVDINCSVTMTGYLGSYTLTHTDHSVIPSTLQQQVTHLV